MKTYRIENLTCYDCKDKIEAKFRAIEGVADARIDLVAKKVVVDGKDVDAATLERIAQSVEADVRITEADRTVYRVEMETPNEGALARFRTDLLERDGVEEVFFDASADTVEIVSARVLTVQEVADLLEKYVPGARVFPYSDADAGFFAVNREELIRIGIALALFLVAHFVRGVWNPVVYFVSYFIAGYPVLFSAIKKLATGKVLDEHFLMTIATAGAWYLREFPEAVGVMIFYAIGEMFEDYAVDRSSRRIEALSSIRPDVVHKQAGDDFVDADVTETRAGDVFLVRTGEKIPADGTVMTGAGEIDVRAMTGEADPVAVSPGDAVTSGAVVLGQALTIRADVDYADSTVAKILTLVDRSRMEKSKTERFITRFARVYTPVVVALAVLIVAVPTLLFREDAAGWLRRALIFLIVSCPCALVTSVPLTFFAGMGAAGKKGILVKGSSELERLVDAKTAIFDKTGTVTEGKFSVTNVVAYGVTEDAVMALAAGAERFSTHPIALSISSAYRGETPPIEDLEEIAGMGLAFRSGGKGYFLGSARAMEARGIAYEPSDGTSVYLTGEKSLVGRIDLKDEVKTGTKEAIEEIRALGMKTVMLTGDRENKAREVAEELSIDAYRAELLPQEKVAFVRDAKKEGTTIFLGDGINDAPAIMEADVGIGMGGVGSDAVLAAADIVFMNDDLEALPRAVKIAKATKTIATENIVMALGVKILFLALGALGMTTIGFAVFADVGVLILAVLNAMRALKL